MVDELLKASRTPDSPLQILQVELEAAIQLIAHTLRLYNASSVRLPQGKSVAISKLGYGEVLCNMGLINAVAAWEGFKGNVVRAVRANGHSFNESALQECLKQTNTYEHILEPLARRDCFVHNHRKVDSQYKRQIPESPLKVGDSVDIDLAYLQDSSEALFETAVELVRVLIYDELLAEDHQGTLGAFQRNPILPRLGE